MSLPAIASRRKTVVGVLAAIALYAAWTLATWLLEGRIETLLRPEAAGDRAIYAIIANLLIGIVAATIVLRLLVARGTLAREATGFGSGSPSAMWLVIALVLGLAFYGAQGAPSLNVMVLTNAFFQVLVVSIAEVVVCWGVAGSVVKELLRPHGRAFSILGAALVSSMLFGLYHFAHSPPFNTLGMVMLLTLVGLVTSVFFFVSRDVYATILLHNFLGMFGVVQALAVAGALDAFAVLQPPLLIMGLVAIAVLALSDRLLLRMRSESSAALLPGPD